MRNRSILAVVTFAAIGLAGCTVAPTRPNYGNFIENAASADGKIMADDAAKKIAALYPPARTRISLRQVTPDRFGASLVAALRAKGYALAEFSQAPSGIAAQTAGHDLSGHDGEAALAYVVDQPLEAGLFRVTILINSQSLSRLYQEKDGSVVPAGYWIRKE